MPWVERLITRYGLEGRETVGPAVFLRTSHTAEKSASSSVSSPEDKFWKGDLRWLTPCFNGCSRDSFGPCAKMEPGRIIRSAKRVRSSSSWARGLPAPQENGL